MKHITNEGENNSIEIDPSVVWNGDVHIIVKGNNNRLFIGPNTVVNGGIIEFQGNQNLISINQQCNINGAFHCKTDNGHLTIGASTTIGWAQITLHEPGSITLGKDCMLWGNIYIDVSDMHSILDVETYERINRPQDIVIGDHVWIGKDVHILKGVNIGKNSIIRVKSLVTKSIPENSMVLGNPAKVIQSGVTWKRGLAPLT